MVSGVQRHEVNEFGRWPCGMTWHTESGEAHQVSSRYRLRLSGFAHTTVVVPQHSQIQNHFSRRYSWRSVNSELPNERHLCVMPANAGIEVF